MPDKAASRMLAVPPVLRPQGARWRAPVIVYIRQNLHPHAPLRGASGVLDPPQPGMTARLLSFNTDKESTMITLYDQIQELRAELRGCGFTRRERVAVEAELARALAEQAEFDRAFDLALEALQPIETTRAA
jgi:hypothetical protein